MVARLCCSLSPSATAKYSEPHPVAPPTQHVECRQCGQQLGIGIADHDAGVRGHDSPHAQLRQIDNPEQRAVSVLRYALETGWGLPRGAGCRVTHAKRAVRQLALLVSLHAARSLHGVLLLRPRAAEHSRAQSQTDSDHRESGAGWDEHGRPEYHTPEGPRVRRDPGSRGVRPCTARRTRHMPNR